LQDVETKVDELKSAEQELRKEISQRKHEIKALKEDLENTIGQNELLEKELDSVTQQTREMKVRVKPGFHYPS